MTKDAKLEQRRRNERQSRRFIEAARELGCDADQETFERAVRQVVQPKIGAYREPRQRGKPRQDDDQA
jgi:hypothetical protein